MEKNYVLTFYLRNFNLCSDYEVPINRKEKKLDLLLILILII